MKLDPHYGMLPIGAFEHCGDRRIRLHGGGGGIPFVSDVIDIVQDIGGGVVDIVDGAVSTVGDVVQGVGNVVEDVVDKAVTTVDNTVTAALDDPVNTAIRATAYVYGGPAGLAAANAAIGVAQGQDLEDVAKNAAVTYAAAQVGSEFSKSLTPELGTTAANVAGQTASTVVRGGDPLAALLSGGVSAGVSEITNDIPGFSELSAAQQRAVNTAVASTLQGRDPTQALVNQAISAGLNAVRAEVNEPTPEEPTFAAPDPDPEFELFAPTPEEPAPVVPDPDPEFELFVPTPEEAGSEIPEVLVTAPREPVEPDDSEIPEVVVTAPREPAPVTPAPVTPAPVTPAPVTPAPVTPKPTTPAAKTGGLDIAALMALLAGMGGNTNQLPATPPATVDIGKQLDLGAPLETNPFAKQQTQTKMAQGGSIDDLLALLRRG